MPVKINKRFFITISIIIGIVGFIFVTYLSGFYNTTPPEPTPESQLKTITKNELLQLFSKHINLTVIDCSPESTNFDLELRLPSATWDTNSTHFYNSNRTLIIYSDDDSISHDFCIDIIKNTEIKVFLFEGGYQKWSE